MKTKEEILSDKQILQNLYDKGMIDFEGDEEDLTLQVPTNFIKTGKYICDVYREGYNTAFVEKDVKDFIKRVTDRLIHSPHLHSKSEVIEIIEEEAGEMK